MKIYHIFTDLFYRVLNVKSIQYEIIGTSDDPPIYTHLFSENLLINRVLIFDFDLIYDLTNRSPATLSYSEVNLWNNQISNYICHYETNILLKLSRASRLSTRRFARKT